MTLRELCEKPVATLPIRAQEECSWAGEMAVYVRKLPRDPKVY